MAYYNKKEVREYIESESLKAEKSELKPLTPIEQPISQLEKEEDVVGYFWLNLKEEDKESSKLKVEGKTFIRIDHDLYTDDRFAIDMFQAQSDGKTVSHVIKARQEEKEGAMKSVGDRKEEIEETIKEKNKKE
jgi:hypothetical protein